MSTILKALRKLEEEKREETPLPALEARALVAPGEPLQRPGRSRPLALLGGLGALVVAVLAAGWWWMGRASAPAAVVPAAPPVVAARSARRPIPPPPQRRAPAPTRASALPGAPPGGAVPSAPASVAPAPAPASVAVPARQVAASAPAARSSAPPPPAHEAPAAAAPVASAAAPALPKRQPTRKAQETRVVRREPRQAARSAPRRAPVPDVAVVPPAPHVEVDEIIWHPDPQRRIATVRIQGRDAPLELHEGDAVGTLVVGEIDPDAVIFLDGTSRLRKGLGETP